MRAPSRHLILVLLLSIVGPTAKAAIDLDVTYITRTPKYYRYQVNYPNGIPTEDPSTAGKKRWPDQGETVTFTAHFKNKGSTTCPAGWTYKWYINGAQVSNGTYGSTLATGAEGTLSIPWVWTTSGLDTDHTDQTVKFEITPVGFSDTYSSNNSATDYIGSVNISIWMDTACYNQLNLVVNGAGTKSAEDWIRWQIGNANVDLGRSSYASVAPNGCLERFRVDKIVVADNCLDAMNADPEVLNTDSRWLFHFDTDADSVNYANSRASSIDWGIDHEIMHQIGVIDLYRLNFNLFTCQVIAPDGTSAGMGFTYPHMGLMGGGDISPWVDGNYLERHTVLGMNKNVGSRRGYYGEYLYDVPQTNVLRILDANGNPAAGVTVRVFQTANDSMDNTADIVGTTGADGTFALPNRSVSGGVTTGTGHTLRDNPFGIINVVGTNGRFLIELSRPGEYDYRWLDILDFNYAYWNGDTASHTYTIQAQVSSPGAPMPPSGLIAKCEGGKATLIWNATPGAASYSIYRAGTENNFLMTKVGTSATNSYVYNPQPRSSRFAVAVKDSAGRESGIFQRAFAPLLLQPYAAAILSDNRRVVLDPQNGYALVHLNPNGLYTDNFGTYDFHLEYSYDVVCDRNLGRLIFAHAGDYYSSNNSVKVSDLTVLNGNGLLEIGTTGTGNGQFSNPTGVAVDNSSRIYVADKGNNRIQVFTSGGAFIAKFGTNGTGNTNLKSPQNLSVSPAGDRIYVADRGNKRVQILSFNGTTISYISTVNRAFADPTDVAVGPDGKLYVADAGGASNSAIYAFGASGNYLQAYTTPTDSYTGRINNPMGVVVDLFGDLVVCDTGNKRVVTIAITTSVDLKTALGQPDGTLVRINDLLVTGKFPGSMYVEDLSRLAGVRVTTTSYFGIGDKVNLLGTLGTSGGERQIVPSVIGVTSTGSVAPAPLGMSLKSLGGAAFGMRPGIDGALGLNNVGLRVRIFGTTSDRNIYTREFNVMDGYGTKVKVKTASTLTIPPDGSKVMITGVSGADDSSGTNVRILRATSIDVLP